MKTIIKRETDKVIDRFIESGEEEQGRELTIDLREEEDIVVELRIYKKENKNEK